MYKLQSATLGPIATNCYMVINEDSNEAVLIDATGDSNSILKMLDSEQDDSKAKLDGILLTHAHFDHVDAVDKIRETFPDVTVYIGENDAPLLEDPMLNLSIDFMGSPVSVKADRTLSDGEELELIGTRIKCIEVPGHTVGGMCYYFTELGLLFDGDTLFHGSVGRSDFPTGDGEALISSIRSKLFTLPDETKVFPGHDSDTTIGWEKENNYYF